jgi:radical SAM protein with 4Fe4S-binding SPASM domain
MNWLWGVLNHQYHYNMTPKEYLSKKNFCVLPWIGVYVQPDGRVQNCAVTKNPLGNINDQPLEDILLGNTNQEIKKDMLSDVFHHGCDQCYTLEKNQKHSMDSVSNRVWYLKTLYDKDLAVFDDAKNYVPKMLDLRWKNTCNFACVYCGPDLSSLWASELNLPQKISDDPLKDSLEYIYTHLDTVNHVYLAGGEPLLIKENLVLLDKMYKINPNVSIRINTNLSILNNDIYNALKRFKNVHWTVSVDNIGEEFEYVRYGGNWATFVENLHQLRKDFDKINFNSVWFILNATGIFDYIDFVLDQGFHENSIIVNPLEYPAHWHVNNLPEETLEQIRSKIKSKLDKTNPIYSLYNSLNLMLNYTNIPHKKNINATFASLDELDKRRKLNSRAIFKDLYKEENHGKTI